MATISLLVLAGFGAVLMWIISFAIRSAKRHDRSERPSYLPSLPSVPPTGAINDGPGRFCIIGVDRETHMDTRWHCSADSPENAKVKAELEGIIVTAVKRVE